MNRARAYNVVLQSLFTLLCLFLVSSLPAQVKPREGAKNAPPPGVPRATTTRAATGRGLAGNNLTQVPPEVTRRRFSSKKGTRVDGDTAVIRQTSLVTKENPGAQLTFVTAKSHDLHPFVTADEKFLYFTSDRQNDVDVPVSTGRFNIFRSSPDGSGVTQVTSGTDNKLEPNVSVDGSRVAYVSGGTFSNLAQNLDNPTTNGFQLFYLDLNTGGNPVSLTARNASGITFVDVRHPSWAPAGDRITFAGRTAADPNNYHIFVINIQSTVVTQFTTGASNNYGPAWSPDGRLIAYTSNATGYNPGTAPLTSSGTVTNDDIWVLNPNPFTVNPKRVTNFAVAGKGQSTNKNPAWSTLRPDPLGIVPPETNANGDAVSGGNLLAFASNRADTAHDGVANDIVGTFDIYFLRTSIKPDTTVPGSFTVVTPEVQNGNTAIKLRTSTPEREIDPNDPASMFDPNFLTNENYPAWPQFINSYRIYFQSDRNGNLPALGTELNIWGSTMFDINAPTLIKYDIPNNEIVHVGLEVPGNPAASNQGRREFQAGQTVRFRTRIVDYESGVESVWIQIKNPNSAPQSPDGLEHKYYSPVTAAIDAAIVTGQPAPFEVEAQAINPATYQFRRPESIPPQFVAFIGRLPGNWPGWNMYLAGQDDFDAFSGGLNPPDDDNNDYTQQGGFWLRCHDDGPVSQGGNEPEGEVSGDGVWSAIWETPQDLPSDWYLDVIARDMSINPFATNERVNWKIYDNVWGFTTAPFLGRGGFLYVNDYSQGQRFFQTRFGPASPVIPGGSGAVLSRAYNGVPTESWMTELDPSLLPTLAINGTTVVRLLNVLTNLGQNSYGQQGQYNSDPGVQDGTNIPPTQRYDIWRILARGPIPDSILNGYRAFLQTQPPDVIAGGGGPRQVTVAERAIIWHAPYAGDLFVGPGTILDSDTQTRLSNFVRTGGRLFVCGQNIAFGLTLSQGGAGVNPFLNQILRASYIGDFFGDFVIQPVTSGIGGVAPRGTHPVVSESWYNLAGPHAYSGTVIPNDPPHTKPMFLRTPNAGTPGRSWGAPNWISHDVVQFLANIEDPDRSGVDAFYNAGGSAANSPAIMWFRDISQSPIISKVVFAPFSWESVNPEFWLEPVTNNVVLQNRRTEMTHNIGDFLRTGRIVGSVRDVNGATPLNRVFLRAITRNPIKNPTGSITNPPASAVIATTYSQSDGSFVLSGLEADATYVVDAIRPGFLTQHVFDVFFHGGWETRIDMFLTPAQPGSIAGRVTVTRTNDPAPGVIVVARNNADPQAPVLLGRSDVNGNYLIQNVPALGTDTDQLGYIVTTPLDPPGNLTALGYGGSIPPSYGGGEQGARPVVKVLPSQNVIGVDFELRVTPGSISGRVTDATNGNPIEGATVTASNTVTGNFTGVTAADGTYSIPNIDPGNYAVVATAPGYAANNPAVQTTVTTNSNTANVNIQLNPIPPGSISGLVATASGIPISGATVTVSNAAGRVLATTTTGQLIDINGYRFNYRFQGNVPAGGTVSVNAARAGFTNRTGMRTAGPINSEPPGPETQGVNFVLEPMHTFPNNLTLVSTPFDYTGVASGDIAQLLSVPQGDITSRRFAFIAWDPAQNRYINYNTAPADTFRLGRGYFLQQTNTANTLALIQEGQRAPQNPDGTYRPFEIQLQTGWNLIGDPFPFSLNFLTLKVREANGTIRDVLSSQTGTTPALGSALWTYENGNYSVVFTLDSYRGYWIRAFRPVTLIVDPVSAQGRSSAQPPMRGLIEGNAQGSGWKLPIVATAGNVRSAPVYVGVHPNATDTFDQFKLEAPPVVGSETVSVSINHTDWADKSGQYNVDVRSVAPANQKWEFTVNSNVANMPVTLNWPALATIPSKYDVFLTDVDTKSTVNLRNMGSYTIQSGRSATEGISRRFTLEVKRAERRSLAITGVDARVNSSTGRGPTAADITYNISADATVQVRILQNGRSVRNLVQGRTRSAGNAQVVWDLRDDKGALVGSNTYLVEVRVRDAKGQTDTRAVPLLITR